VPNEVTKLKQQAGGDLLVYGHGLLGETLLRHGLLDAIDVSIHPIVLGSGRLPFRDGQAAQLNLVATKTFSQIIKLTYEPSRAVK
jgi:dihydrofolate reductase